MLLRFLFIGIYFGSLVSVVAQEQDSINIQNFLETIYELDCEDAVHQLNNLLVEKEVFFQTNAILLSDVHFALSVNHYFCGDSEVTYQKAHHHHQVAFAIREKKLAKGHPKIIQSYHALSVLHNNFGYFEKAIAAGHHAATLLEQKKEEDILMKSKVYYNLSTAYEETGDLETALIFNKKALTLSQEIKAEARIIACLNNMGLIYKAFGNFQEALEVYQKIESASDLADEDLANCYNNMGLIYLDLKQFDSALHYFEFSKTINTRLYKSEKYSEDHLNLAENLENEGIAYTEKKQYAKAIQQINASMKILQQELQTKHHPDIGRCYDNMGDIFFRQADYKKAIPFYQQGIHCLVPGFTASSDWVNPDFQKMVSLDKYYLLNLLSSKARSFHKLYQNDPQDKKALAHAFAAHQNLDTLITQIRQHFQGAESKYALIEKSIPIYEEAIQVALELHRISGDLFFLERAYQFCAKNKAIVLLEGLHDEQAKYANIPVELIKKEQDIRNKSMKLEAQFYDWQIQGAHKKVDSLKNVLFYTRRTYDTFIKNLEKIYPNYHELKYGFIQAPKPSFLQSQIPEDALLLEYFIGEKQLFLFAFSAKKAYSFASPKPKNFDQLCLDFRTFSSEDQFSQKEKYNSIAYQLYEYLLKEALEKATADQTIKRLFIVPDDQLSQISFDNLFYEKNESWNNQTNPYLIKKYAISYAYTAKLFFDRSTNQRLEKAKKNFAGFGLIYDDYTLEGLRDWHQNIKKQDPQKRQVGKLQYATQEVQEIAQIFNGDSWIDQQATQPSFLKNAGNYQILHLAMHAMENKDFPMHSALAFSRTKDASPFLLRASDIYALPLQANLAVLSACDTGSGKLNKGEGVRSLARAFSYAGCPAIIANLWSASDASSKEILIPFYQNLKKGQSKDIALQNAKLQYLKESPPSYISPAYWANLVILGSAEPIDFKASRSFSFLWILAGLFLLFGFIWLFRQFFYSK